MLRRPRAGLVPALALCCVLASAAAALDHERLGRAIDDAYGKAGVQALREWQALLQEARALPERERLRRVNDFFNARTRFADDEQVWGRPDYWATPLETLARGEGDCEDFTIAKYFTLRELEVPTARLRLTYVKARIGGVESTVTQAHMVLAYYPAPEAEALVLDNLIGEIRPAGRRADLTPVFGFNSDSLWLAGESSAAGAATARLSRWRELLARMRKEGFE